MSRKVAHEAAGTKQSTVQTTNTALQCLRYFVGVIDLEKVGWSQMPTLYLLVVHTML